MSAVWSVRSIEGLGYERDFYVHMRHGTPVSVETTINHRLETPDFSERDLAEDYQWTR